MVLISPTIVKPYVEGGMDVFTAGKMGEARDYITEDLAFINKRDPITRWFFKPNLDCPYGGLDSYLDQSYYDEDTAPDTDSENEGAAATTKLLKSVSEHARTVSFDEPYIAPETRAVKPQNRDVPAQDKLKQLVHNEDNPLLVKKSKDESVLNT
jgi:hypothetical protein